MRRILLMALALVPATPLIVIGFTPEYWGRIYLPWGIIFAGLNCMTLWGLSGREGHGADQTYTTRQIFLRQLVAWCLSLVALGVIDLTPLCLGHDNGDGNNDLGMCGFLTVLWGVSMSVVVLPLAYMTAAGARRVGLPAR